MDDGYELPIQVPRGTVEFMDQQGLQWTLKRHPASLPVEDKVRLVNEVLIPLRSYQMLGLIESRAWIETLFPEFGDFRDREMDEYLHSLANADQEVPQDVSDQLD